MISLSEIGLQRADDYSPIHLDFLLEDFDGAQRFLSDLFDNICSQGIEDFRGNVLFEDRVDAMNILTEASGGNPRSFINLLKELLIYYKPQLSPLGYHEIRRVCVNYLKRARQEAVESYSNYELLHQLLTVIVDLCQRHHDIAFCLSKYEIHAYPKLGGLISQLVDLRLIHLLTTSYPPPVGDRLIYVLSVGVYDELGDPYDYWKNERLTNRIFNSTKDYPQLECSELPLHILS